MTLAMYVMIGSLLGLVFTYLLFRAESLRGQRLILSNIRGRADRYLVESTRSFMGVKKVFGASSLRLFFHYLLHQFLSVFLFLVRFAENKLQRLRLKNKVVAKVIREQVTDNHLTHIARHKEEVALSEEEREERKKRSMHD